MDTRDRDHHQRTEEASTTGPDETEAAAFNALLERLAQRLERKASARPEGAKGYLMVARACRAGIRPRSGNCSTDADE